MATKKILILEDNQDFITLYKDILGEQNQLTIVTSLKELQKLLEKDQTPYDLVISDLKLPDGFFLNWIKEHKSNLMERFPTIIVSSLEDLEVLRASFEWGATDYLIKPFRNNELIAKMDKSLRDYAIKNNSNSAQEFLDELTSMERKIFQRLLATPDQLITRDRLTSDIWKQVTVHPKTIDQHLMNLRRKLTNSDWVISNQHEMGWKISKKVLN